MEDAMKLMEEMNRFEAEIATDGSPSSLPEIHRPIIGANTFQTVQKRLDSDLRPGGPTLLMGGGPPGPLVPMKLPVPPPPPPPCQVPHGFPGPVPGVFPSIPPPPPPPPFLIPHQVRGMRPMPPVRLPPPPPPIASIPRQRPGPVVLSAAPTKYKSPTKKSKIDDELSEFLNEIKKEEEKMNENSSKGEKSAAKLMAEKVKANTVVSIQPIAGELPKEDSSPQTSQTKGKKEKKIKKSVRMAGGQSWEDNSLVDWEDDDFRIFCGDLGNDVTDEILIRAFNKYPSFLKAKVVRDKRTNKTKGFGFVSFKDPQDFIKAMKEMNAGFINLKMISDPLLFTFALMNSGATLFLLVYFVMTLSDFECDYLNAQQCCSKLNSWVTPKFVAHAILTLLFLLTGHWWLFLANLPVVVWLGREMKSVPTGNFGVYDPTEIYNKNLLKTFMRDVLIQIGFYLIIFFVYLYCLILAFLKTSPIEKSDEIVTKLG